MARGDMLVEKSTFGAGAEILNRPPYEAVPMTVNFTSVTDTDDTGKKIVKAGTPIDASGAPVTATPWTGAVGILFLDTREDRPQGQILTKAYINVTRAQENSGLTYDAALVNAMINAKKDVQFENPIIVGTLA